jgi:outer membrane receptor for ferrienterochelin and colicins
LGLSLPLLVCFWICSALTSRSADPGPGPVALSDLADLPLEALPQIPIETVSGASRYLQKETQAPASVSIVTSDEIKKEGYRTLAEILNSVRGLYVTSDRNYSYLGMRGFARPGDYNSRVLLLIDGHRLNDDIYGQALLGTEGVIEVDLIDHVEVIRGPSSSIYGGNAFLGVISIVTRRGGDINGLEASVSAGGYDSHKGRVTFGQKVTNGLELVVSGSWYDSAGPNQLYFREFDVPGGRQGIAYNSDGDQSQSAFASLTWKDFTLAGGFSNREKKVPTASFDTVFNSDLEQTTDQRAYVDFKFEHEFSLDTRLMTRVAYDYYSYHGNYPYDATNSLPDATPGQIVVNHDDALGEWLYTEWQLTQKLFDRHTLVVGADYHENLVQSQDSFYDEPGLPNVQIDRSSGRNAGVYGQAEVGLLPNLTFNGGVRYDYYDSFGGTVNPRLGLIYNPWQQSTFKLLYGQAFRAPNVFELYYEDPGANRANPSLSPETIHTYELVYEQQLPANVRFSASGYYYEINNLISQQEDGLGQSYYANLGQAHAKGVELELDHKSACGLMARLSYVCQRAQDTTTGEDLSNSPRNQVKLNLILPVYEDKLFTGLEVLCTSPVHTMTGHRIDGYVLANFTLFSQRIVKGLELSASIYNLLDTRYSFAASADLQEDALDQDGRSFRVKLTYRF